METPGIAAMEAAYFNKPIVIHMLKNEQYDTQELIKQYSWSNIAELYVKHYNEILLTHSANR